MKASGSYITICPFQQEQDYYYGEGIKAGTIEHSKNKDQIGNMVLYGEKDIVYKLHISNDKYDLDVILYYHVILEVEE